MLRGLDGYLLILVVGQLCGFQAPAWTRRRSLALFGGHSEGETPLPIPNRAVKPLRADGTWPSRAWESRSPPNYFSIRAVLRTRAARVLPGVHARAPAGRVAPPGSRARAARLPGARRLAARRAGRRWALHRRYESALT